MKKILFIIPSFDTGGTITSLKNLLPLIPKNFALDVYPISNEGSSYDYVAQYAHILVLKAHVNSNEKYGLKQIVRNALATSVRALKRSIFKLGVDISPIIFKIKARSLSKNNYYSVISFQEGQATRLASYVKCTHRVAWVHSLFSRFAFIPENKGLLKYYTKYNKIVCVSNTAAEDMRLTAPHLANRICTVYNAINSNLIISLAGDGESKQAPFVISSVGRIDPVKRFSRIPEIAAQLKRKGFDFQWNIIGGIAVQEEADLLMRNINFYNVSDCVTWHGQKNNPYPYIKSSDLMVCLSSSETFNYTIAEAKVLRVPVVTTDFPSAFEFIENLKTGIIVPIEEIAYTIEGLVSKEQEYITIKNNFNQIDEQNTTVSQFLECMKNGIL